jgi:AraC family transcriptional regulator of adaptative response / DNA-3-methyladenine glycosylase II
VRGVSELDHQAMYRAVLARDRRFDGSFFTAVKSTSIFCRPVCPARTPSEKNCAFFASAAAALSAGYRPCLRCRPELSPTSLAWRGTENTVSRALALIERGALSNDHTVDELAARLGVGERHLRRLFAKHLHSSPIACAQTHRVLFAKRLLHDSTMSIAQVALACGFASVRRFNEAFSSKCALTPSQVRRARAPDASTEERMHSTGTQPSVCVKIGYVGAYDWAHAIAQLTDTVPTGSVRGHEFSQTITTTHTTFTFWVAHRPGHLLLTLQPEAIATVPMLLAEIRRAFDLDADLPAIAQALASDPLLRPHIERRPGLRLISPVSSLRTDLLARGANSALAHSAATKTERTHTDEQWHASDRFDATDERLVRATQLAPKALLARAEQWRPWRGYAANWLTSSLKDSKR